MRQLPKSRIKLFGLNIPLLITQHLKNVRIKSKHLSLNELSRGGFGSKRRDSAILFYFQMLAAHSFLQLRLPNKLDALRSALHRYRQLETNEISKSTQPIFLTTFPKEQPPSKILPQEIIPLITLSAHTGMLCNHRNFIRYTRVCLLRRFPLLKVS